MTDFLTQRVQAHFEASIAAKQAALDALVNVVGHASKKMVQALTSGKKILCCGNGGSAADAQHFAAELINRFELERPPLPAIALCTDGSVLTAIGNDYDYSQVFSKAVKALGQTGDVLVALSTSGQSDNICNAITAAQQQGLWVLALTGKDGGKVAPMLGPNDIELRVPHTRTAHIQETHIVLLHCLCDLIDTLLFQPNLTPDTD